MEKSLNTILNTDSKITILRFFVFREEGFQATGREIARLVGISAPAAHASLKDLYNQHILYYDLQGKNHQYHLNYKNKIVKGILMPMFFAEQGLRSEMFNFIVQSVAKETRKRQILSIIFYGSRKTNKSRLYSDLDIAVIVQEKKFVNPIEALFIENISEKFWEFFGMTLDAYVKSKKEFMQKLRLRKPPVCTMMDDFEVIYGDDPQGWRVK